MSENVARIRGADTMIALPNPDKDTRFGPLMTAVLKSSAISRIGTNR
ncbi:hypothetical protein ACFSQQ_01655 [Mesorhizobium kowhaii]